VDCPLDDGSAALERKKIVEHNFQKLERGNEKIPAEIGPRSHYDRRRGLALPRDFTWADLEVGGNTLDVEPVRVTCAQMIFHGWSRGNLCIAIEMIVIIDHQERKSNEKGNIVVMIEKRAEVRMVI
jgi:hypothetical protein